MFSTSAICSKTRRLEVALHSSRKKSVIIIYTQAQNIILKLLHRAVGSPMSPHYGGLVSIYVEGSDFLGEVFSFEPFLYGSLSSRSSWYASSYSHANKTHFHEKVSWHFLIASRCFGTRKGPILSWGNGILFVVLRGTDWGRCKHLDSL